MATRKRPPVIAAPLLTMSIILTADLLPLQVQQQKEVPERQLTLLFPYKNNRMAV
jgi:hypothetical protein